MPTKKEVEALTKKVQEIRKVMKTECDQIDDLIGELEEMKEVCDRAYEALEVAVEALQELV